MPYTNYLTNRYVRQPVTALTRSRAFPANFAPLQVVTSVDGVFQGGGALGTAYVGALRALHDNNIWFARVAGNSAGSITAAMIAVGFTAPEIQWLCSAFPGAPAAPTSLHKDKIDQPIHFKEFLDFPSFQTISNRSKHISLLWNALKGTLLDEIGKMAIPTITQKTAVDTCKKNILAAPLLGALIKNMPVPPGMPNGPAVLEDILNQALSPLPNRQMRIRDFFWNTQAMRIALADTLWDAIVRNFPMLAIVENLIYEGSIYEGTKFLNTLKELFGKRKHQNAKATVLFKDLEIPLAVIAADIETGRMVVYNSYQHPNMEVAEAVRQSMSIPFVFQPRGGRKQFVDGGLYSNFPAWLMSTGGRPYWKPSVIDDTRMKIGFLLNDKEAAPPAWNVQPPRFRVVGNPPQVNKMEVLKPILVDGIVYAFNTSRSDADAAVTLALLGNNNGSSNSGPGVEILREIFGVATNGALKTEEATRLQITNGLMANMNYIDVSIPLLGYDGFDFEVNEDEGDLFAMCDRAWNATMEALKAAGSKLPSTVRLPANPQTPFH